MVEETVEKIQENQEQHEGDYPAIMKLLGIQPSPQH